LPVNFRNAGLQPRRHNDGSLWALVAQTQLVLQPKK
jgi:hypothetical protein